MAIATKTIDTLVTDIYDVLTSDEGIEVSDEQIQELSNGIAETIKDRLGRVRGRTDLRMSNLGTPCDRKLWYSINKPELGERLGGAASLKFLYGDIIERVILGLAKIAGHTVTGEQTELNIDGVPGHRDAVIDGRLVDVKSATTHSFNKFKEHKLTTDDPFGYLIQIGAYLDASQEDELVKDKDKASFVAVDKQLGHICIDTYNRDTTDYAALVLDKRSMVSEKEPPARGFTDVPDGKSGNRKLCTECSYCPFKAACWPGLRTFTYSNGPTFLTKVEREPKVEEYGRHKKF